MKNHRKIVSAAVIAVFAVFYFIATMPQAHSYPPFLNKAKQMGLPAKDCTYCHVSAQGGDQHNARGNWLVEQKKVKKAYAVDVAWLKEYNEKAPPSKGRSKKKP